ncbi:helix-turn-helix domain-containing protein [Priestia megaterium]|uniref:helix-turn-helix domain-containing protein n=1 Tax=Priestia megaterium TaxID=1404 RepID=UPI00300A043B
MNAKTFRLIRLHTGLTQQAFANLIGVSKPTVSMIELGQRTITPVTVAKLARHFELTDEFLTFIEKFDTISKINDKTRREER